MRIRDGKKQHYHTFGDEERMEFKNCLSVLSLLEDARSQSVPPTTWKQT
jgi:hypothetical protein